MWADDHTMPVTSQYMSCLNYFTSKPFLEPEHEVGSWLKWEIGLRSPIGDPQLGLSVVLKFPSKGSGLLSDCASHSLFFTVTKCLRKQLKKTKDAIYFTVSGCYFMVILLHHCGPEKRQGIMGVGAAAWSIEVCASAADCLTSRDTTRDFGEEASNLEHSGRQIRYICPGSLFWNLVPAVTHSDWSFLILLCVDFSSY